MTDTPTENTRKMIIFDLDGTLVDAYKAVSSSVNFTLRKVGCPLVDDETIKRKVGWGDKNLLLNFVPMQGIDRALSIYRRHHAQALKQGTKFLPGARKVIRKLKKHYALAIASNRPTKFTRIILKYLGALTDFKFIVCGDKVKHPKPAPDILHHILKRAAFVPSFTPWPST